VERRIQEDFVRSWGGRAAAVDGETMLDNGRARGAGDPA
jgi:hypothetical protein